MPMGQGLGRRRRPAPITHTPRLRAERVSVLVAACRYDVCRPRHSRDRISGAAPWMRSPCAQLAVRTAVTHAESPGGGGNTGTLKWLCLHDSGQDSSVRR